MVLYTPIFYKLFLYTATTIRGYTDDGSTPALSVTDNSNVELLRINTDGNIGIGTVSPASKLTVDSGDVEIIGDTSGVILESPDGTRYRVTVANGGTLNVVAV